MSKASSNFRLYGDDGLLVSVGAASAAIALPSDAFSASAPDIAIYNRGSIDATVKLGGAGVEATALSIAIRAGGVQTFRRGAGNTHLAAICPGGGSTELVAWLGKGRLSRRATSAPAPAPPPPSSDAIHGEIRATVAAAKKSVHAASSVVSAGAGRLYGFLVVAPGSSGTMTVYDHASAPSGTVLRTVAAAELVRGAWIYCGPNGLAAASGIYVALGGATAPVVCAIFDGSYPAVAHAGAVRYIDGTGGDDSWDGTAGTFQGGSVGPKKTWGTGYTSGNWHIYCKRGTTIDISESSLTHIGTDWLVEDYGDTGLAKPVLRQSATKSNAFSFTATSGVVEFRNLRIVSLLATRKSGGGFNVPAGARMICTNTEADNFATGHLFGGQYGVVDGCTETHCTNGSPQGNNSFAAPDYGIVMNSSLTADSDAYSLHNGTGTGDGNVCISSTLTLDPTFVPGTAGIEPENCADINAQFTNTLIAFCTINGSTLDPSDSSVPKAIASDSAANGVALVANLVNCGSAAGMQLRAPNWTATGNVVKTVGTCLFNAACLLIDGATNLKLYGNYLYMNAASTKPMVLWVANASDGEMKNNILESANATQTILSMGAGAVAGWGAGKWATNDYYAPGITGTTTFADISGGGGPQTLASFSGTYAGGTELNVAPALDASYRLPGGSALIGAGTSLAAGVCYMGFDGPFWLYGTPSVGATDPQWA